ncbi:MAG TPA: tRNA preQ1(34) S-adenosylmethionine ribosyltransferase-isomerase QueA [Clostridiales bacterium]|nr:tRNA preQ1(34) S-adenosylmethionine ribosyltransferase-isomerase QueA [Clostridiales bacterium]
MKLEDFLYELPEDLIAQVPLNDRDMSRLMVVDASEGSIRHNRFKDVLNYIHPGDCIVLNDTRVIPARLNGFRKDTGGRVELVLLREKERGRWEALAGPGRKARPGDRIVFGNGVLEAEVQEITEEGNRIVKFHYAGIFQEVLDQVGVVPLPPYIHTRLKDPERYQTVYARERGSAAAPTAGLHFTVEMLDRIRSRGIDTAYVTLHVGLGTFRPVKVEDIENHVMHEEYYQVTPDAAAAINRARQRGGRIMAVGTTSVRVLESATDPDGLVNPMSGWTKLFIRPGYHFQSVDGMITNFHLPGSTLLMLVCAFAGRKLVLKAYNEAVSNRYRFFSFGDAMLLLSPRWNPG